MLVDLSRSEIIKELQDFFSKKKEISKASLFGSFARDENNEESDIDILLEMQTVSLLTFIQIKQDLEALTQKKIDLLTKESISARILPFIQKDLVTIYERQR